MEIVWDDIKRERNLRDHRLDFADAREGFVFAEAVVVGTYPGKDGRPRFKAPFDGRLIAIIFSPLGTEAISLISMRRAGRKERRLYEQTEKTRNP
jgi:uncharacterized protein